MGAVVAGMQKFVLKFYTQSCGLGLEGPGLGLSLEGSGLVNITAARNSHHSHTQSHHTHTYHPQHRVTLYLYIIAWCYHQHIATHSYKSDSTALLSSNYLDPVIPAVGYQQIAIAVGSNAGRLVEAAELSAHLSKRSDGPASEVCLVDHTATCQTSIRVTHQPMSRIYPCHTTHRPVSHIDQCHIDPCHSTHRPVSHIDQCHIDPYHSTHRPVSHIDPCHTSTSVTHRPVPHIDQCHTSISVIHRPVSHFDLCHTLTRVIHRPVSHLDLCHTTHRPMEMDRHTTH